MSGNKEVLIIFVLFVSLFVFMLVTFILLILVLMQKKHKGFNAYLLEIKAKYDQELSRAHIETQEQILRQIGRELHDNVGQMLSLVKLGIRGLKIDQNEEAKNTVEEVMDILEKTLADIRDISRSMNFDSIRNGGLVKSIEMQVAFMQRTGNCNVEMHIHGDVIPISNDKEIILFRILQEAISNTLRHSIATNILISLIYDSKTFKLQIEDNGKGFDLANLIAIPNQINGIYNMQCRAKLIGSEFNMDSKPGAGTTVTITTKY